MRSRGESMWRSMLLYSTFQRYSKHIEVMASNANSKRKYPMTGIQAKYLFCFLIHKNSNGKYNFQICHHIPWLRKIGMIYNEDTRRYLAFEYNNRDFRVRDNLTFKEAILFLRREANFNY